MEVDLFIYCCFYLKLCTIVFHSFLSLLLFSPHIFVMYNCVSFNIDHTVGNHVIVDGDFKFVEYSCKWSNHRNTSEIGSFIHEFVVLKSTTVQLVKAPFWDSSFSRLQLGYVHDRQSFVGLAYLRWFCLLFPNFIITHHECWVIV